MSRVYRHRIARKAWQCSNPLAYIWCEGQIKPGRYYTAVIDQDGGTSRLAGILCSACDSHGAAFALHR